MNHCRLALLVAVAVQALLAHAAGGQTSGSGLRLDGTFIQFQPWMLKMDAADWERELAAIKAARMNTIILQFTQVGQTRYFGGSSSAPAESAGLDLVEATLEFAEKNRMEVHLGLINDGQWFKQWSDPAYQEQAATASMRLVDDLWRRFGKYRSLAGWYIPYETWDGPYTDEQIANLRKLFRTISDHSATLGSRPKPVSIAPYCSGRSKPGEFAQIYAAMLIDSGVDIVMLQDGVGANGRDGDPLEIVRYFQEMRDACLAAGCELWSDLECFKLVEREGKPKGFAPADAERTGYQMAIQWPFVKRMVTFDFFHYMSPYRNEAAKRLNADYMNKYVKRDWLPVLGPGPTIDANFGYYRDRSPESIAAELRANGYGIAHCIVTAESSFNPPLLAALHRERIGAWYMTWGNGTYSTADLPKGWESWKMVTRSDLEGKPLSDGFTRLCLNNPNYRQWRKRQVASFMRKLPFDGVEIIEPYWTEYPGTASKAYGCFCTQCLTAFTRMFPNEKALPDIIHEDSPASPKRNPELWRKWLQFRQASATDYLHDYVNGQGGLRETVPDAAVCVWSLALKNGLQQVREDNGEDPEDIARTVKPDLYGLQTHWPDWLKPDLVPDYAKDYLPFIEQIRKANPCMPILIQADTGSNKDNRRSWQWIRDFERACWKLGATSTTFYEYFIGLYMYTDPPRVAEVRRQGRQVVLVFTKRLDRLSAGKPSHYQLKEVGSEKQIVSVVEAKVDGNLVMLTLRGAKPRALYELNAKEISDAADRRLIGSQPPAILKLQTLRFRY